MSGRTRDQLKEMFDVFDQDKSGKISQKELENVLHAIAKKYNQPLSDDACKDKAKVRKKRSW